MAAIFRQASTDPWTESVTADSIDRCDPTRPSITQSSPLKRGPLEARPGKGQSSDMHTAARPRIRRVLRLGSGVPYIPGPL